MWFGDTKENTYLIAWRPIEEAPHDGTWVLLDIEDGSTDGGDMPYSSVYVGRWNPKNYPDLGSHYYEWEIVVRYPDSRPGDSHAGELTNHYSQGRVGGWLPLPTHD